MPSVRRQICSTVREIFLAQAELWLRALGTLHEQAHCRQLSRIGVDCIRLVCQPLYNMALLAAHIQPLARGRHDAQLRRGLQEFDYQPGPVKQVLEVVENQQELLGAQGAHQPRGQVAILHRQIERAHDRGCQGIGGGERRQRDEVRAVGEQLEGGARQLQRQAGLSHAARADDRQQPGLRRVQRRGQLGQIGLAPDEGRERRRQVMRG